MKKKMCAKQYHSSTPSTPSPSPSPHSVLSSVLKQISLVSGLSLLYCLYSFLTWPVAFYRFLPIFFKNVWQIEYICIQNRQVLPSCLCNNYHDQVNTNMHMFVCVWWGQVNYILCYFHLTIYPVNYFIASRNRSSSYFLLVCLSIMWLYYNS